MPKSPRTQEEVEVVKEQILDTALQLIIEDGFNNLSMRKIAARLDITATTIYNYYTGKNELNLMIYIRGFEILYGMMREKRDDCDDPARRVEGMIRAYVDFALAFPDYYDIMFNMHTPKYSDYIGTDMEPLAFREKQIALKCFEIILVEIREMTGTVATEVEEFFHYTTLRFWSDLHGIISLYNSRVLYEVDEGSDRILARRVDDLVLSLLQLKEANESGNLDPTYHPIHPAGGSE
ncbi:MAG: TetR/AcrR family transcriptional regulator [Chrysiogenales bacterium]|nr:MAG: TetR/AcrR family transcriptional regulator [Chrysiogenales bacterium]